MSSPYSPRMKAISTPCPSCLHLTPRAASIISTGVAFLLLLAWSILLFEGHSKVNSIEAAASGTSASELSIVSCFLAFSTLFTSTFTLNALGAFIFGWLCSWAIGVFGIVTYLSTDAFFADGCVKGAECWTWQQRLQIIIVASLFITLIFIFWFAVVFSAYVHTLHPHIFRSPDSDSEDDFSDGEDSEDEHEKLDEKLSQRGATPSGYPPSYQSGSGSRSNSRRRQPYADESDGLDDAALFEFSPEKQRRRPSRERQASAATHYSESSSDGQSDASNGEDEAAQRAGLIASSDRAKTARRAGVASGRTGSSTAPPAYSSGTRSQRATGVERSMSREGSRSRSTSRRRE